ncbi:MAG: PadR family transcriptional regulator [Candidatus Electryonea clarkiae]|nr:PadR family transcriptional regulator [Candidatus Electryonea clarkiae]MDP8288188.1 PadR family transcriptional regulator [Candidatus Electryonea clarkiae]
MELLTNAEAALLGLLSEKPRYPYEIEKEVEQRSMREWTDLSMSSIYKLLRKLEANGYVQAEIEISEENRARKIYHLTKEGRTGLQNIIGEILSVPEKTKWQMDIGISFLTVLDSKKAIECLLLYRTSLEDKIAGYKELEIYLQNEGCPIYRMDLTRRPVRLWEGELIWINEYIEELSEGANNHE